MYNLKNDLFLSFMTIEKFYLHYMKLFDVQKFKSMRKKKKFIFQLDHLVLNQYD